MFNTLCLSGGGVKGISFIGVIKFLEKKKHFTLNKIEKFIGTSIGSILSFLFNIGYNIDEIVEFVMIFDFMKFEPDADCAKFFLEYGIDNGQKIITALKTFLFDKLEREDITFLELKELTNKELFIIVTNYTKGEEEVFSYKNHPDLSVFVAIRMSFSIPLLFTPVKFNNEYYIDGGLTNNFGIKYCDKETTLGIISISKNNNSIDSLYNYITGVCNILVDTLGLNDTKYDTYNFVKINDIIKNSMNFKMDEKTKLNMLECGKKYAEIYYNDFIVKDILDDIINRI